ncbi:haloacid dehalogenase type II [Roseateles puraquae]|jgi:2-haloacid dehalogenase|nr:haloacid dehalogenase type II [Roseateles puraquae]
MPIRALTFDTGGTVLDWHGGLVRRLNAVCGDRLAGMEPHVLVNDWRKRAMKAIVGQLQPAFNMDDVHRETLGATLQAFGLVDLSASEREALWRGWYELDAWPDFPAALQALGRALPVVSFTMLPTALVMGVSRRNALAWDAIISCEMIGVYKPHAEAYATAARWLGLAPQDILMVACHNFDLNAAQAAGFKTAFVRRPDEWGPQGPQDPHPNRPYDLVVDGFEELRRQVLNGPGAFPGP